MKLKDAIKESWLNDKAKTDKPMLTTEQKADILRKIAEYNKYSKAIYNENDLIKIANDLSEMAQNAETLALSETEDQFDRITVTRNMKELKNLSNQFAKSATEAQAQNQRISGLYEDMGTILNRYFDIQEIQEQLSMNEDVSNSEILKAVKKQGDQEADTMAKSLVAMGKKPEDMNKMGSQSNNVNVIKNKLKNRNRA